MDVKARKYERSYSRSKVRQMFDLEVDETGACGAEM